MTFDLERAPQLDLSLLPAGVPDAIAPDQQPGGLINRVYAFDGTLLYESRMSSVEMGGYQGSRDVEATVFDPRSRDGFWVMTYDGDTGLIFGALRSRPAGGA